MASITLTVGPLTSELTFANDAKVQATLERFFEIERLAGQDDPAALSNQEKLDRVNARIVQMVIEAVRHYEVRQRRHAETQVIKDEVDTEFDFRGE